MLTIIYGDEPQSIYNTNVYFKNTYDHQKDYLAESRLCY